jgi:hypothetical protein
MPNFRAPFEKITDTIDYFRNNYSLFEISATLIIIGLILGGAAQMRAQIKQIQTYESAINMFQQKFNGYPGDFARADDYFSDAISGNGNNVIDAMYDVSQNDQAYWDLSYEMQQVFVQLSLAGMADRPFDGSLILNQGIPATHYDNNAGFFIASSSIFSGPSSENTSNVMWFVACNYDKTKTFDNVINKWFQNCGIFKPGDLHYMDVKMDDAKPQSGKLRGFGQTWAHKESKACVQNAAYSVDDSEKICQAAYILN